MDVKGFYKINGPLALLEMAQPSTIASYGQIYADSTSHLPIFVSAGGTAYKLTQGSGTLNYITKWSNTNGGLANSTVSDDGTWVTINSGATLVLAGGNGSGKGNVKLTAAPSPSYDTNLFTTGDNSYTMGMLCAATMAFATANGPFVALRGNTYSSIATQRGNQYIAAGNPTTPAATEGALYFLTGADATRLFISNGGNVSIGNNTSPNELLTVEARISQKETTSPTATASYGKLWIDSTSHKPMFMDSSGNILLGWGGSVPGNNTIAGPYAGNTTMTLASATQNVLYGFNAGAETTTGSSNSFYGYCAGLRYTTGSNATLIGNGAGARSNAGTMVCVGRSAGVSANAASTVTIGHQSLGGYYSSRAFTSVADNGSGKCRFTTTAYNFIETGFYVWLEGAVYRGYYAATPVSGNTFDCATLTYTTTDSGNFYYAMSGNYNTALGTAAGGYMKPSGTENLLAGYYAGYFTRSSYSTYMGGYFAGYGTSGNYNIGVGRYTLGGRYPSYTFSIVSVADNGSGKPRFTMTSSYPQVQEGNYVIIYNSTYYNGYYEVSNVTPNTFDIAALSFVGTSTGNVVTSSTSDNSVAIGAEAASWVQKGNYGTYVGSLAGQKSFSGSSKTYIGYSAGRYTLGDSNTFVGSYVGQGHGGNLTIASITDNGSGKARVTTTTAHYLYDQQYVTIENNASYSGYWQATLISPTVIDITSLTYSASGTTGTLNGYNSTTYDIGVGYACLLNPQGGSSKISMGFYSQYISRNVTGTISLGYSSCCVSSGSYNIAMGYRSLGGYYNPNDSPVTISSVADNGSGKPRFITNVNHQLSDQQYVYITTAVYGGYYQITWVDATHFDITTLTYSTPSTGKVYSSVSGTGNIAIGNAAAYVLSTGQYNVILGYASAYSLKTGSSNVFVGPYSGYTNVSGQYNVFLGPNAGYYETGSNKLFIDYAMRTDEATARTLALIYGEFAATVGSQYVRINGHLELPERTAPTATSGYGKYWISSTSPYYPYFMNSSGITLLGWGGRSNASTSVFGPLAGNGTSTAVSNTLFGVDASPSIGTGTVNCIFGASAAYQMTNSSANCAFGASALTSVVATGHYNSAFGRSSLYTTTGTNNAAFGYYSGKYETGSYYLYIDTIDRTTEALGKTMSLIYGKFDASIDNQFVRINGALELAERTAPTATSGYGKIWTSSTSPYFLHFMDRSGKDYVVNVTETGSVSNNYLVRFYGTGGALTYSSLLDDGTTVTCDANMALSSTKAYYIGPTSSDGSWRFTISGTSLNVERRESGSWIAKGSFTA